MTSSGVEGVREERQAKLLERIALHAPLQEILDEIVLLLEDQLPGSIGSLLLLADGRLRSGSVRGLPAGFTAAIEGIAIGPQAGSCGTSAFRAAPVIVTDTELDPLWGDYRELARTYEMRACWSTPILSRRHRGTPTVLGTFAVYFHEPMTPDQRALEALAKAESLACIALDADHMNGELRESEARSRIFVDHASDAFFVFDDETTVVDLNHQACASLGYTREELLGKPPAFFDPDITPDTFVEVTERLRAGETVTFDSRHMRKNRSVFPVEVRIRAFETRGRGRTLALVSDITARREREDHLRESQKLEAVGQLAGGVAHDFNNLLTVINGHVEMLLEDSGLDGQQREDLGLIRAAGNRAAALTAQLLAFSRRSIIAPRTVDLAVLLERLSPMFRRILGDTITLEFELAAPIHTVLADPAQLEQVFVSLVANARDAMAEGGRLVIATKVVNAPLHNAHGKLASKSQVCVALTDTGPGMPEAVRARVFEPFFTTKPQGRSSGLGLATAYGIVRQANGTIRVDSEPNKGSTFVVMLPAVEGSDSASVAPREFRHPRGTQVVLLAEDEEGVRRLITRGLQSHGYTVLSACDGYEAIRLEAAHPGTIDLLLTDVVMPGMNGRALADAIRQLRPTIKVLYMSGYTDDEVVRHGVIAARDAFLQKPITPAAVLAKIRAIFEA